MRISHQMGHQMPKWVGPIKCSRKQEGSVCNNVRFTNISLGRIIPNMYYCSSLGKTACLRKQQNEAPSFSKKLLNFWLITFEALFHQSSETGSLEASFSYLIYSNKLVVLSFPVLIWSFPSIFA